MKDLINIEGYRDNDYKYGELQVHIGRGRARKESPTRLDIRDMHIRKLRIRIIALKSKIAKIFSEYDLDLVSELNHEKDIDKIIETVRELYKKNKIDKSVDNNLKKRIILSCLVFKEKFKNSIK